MNATGLAITPIGENVISGLEGILVQRFTGAGSFAGCDLKVIADQRRPLETIMDTPQTAGLARFLHNRRIDQTQRSLSSSRKVMLITLPYADS